MSGKGASASEAHHPVDIDRHGLDVRLRGAERRGAVAEAQYSESGPAGHRLDRVELAVHRCLQQLVQQRAAHAAKPEDDESELLFRTRTFQICMRK